MTLSQLIRNVFIFVLLLQLMPGCSREPEQLPLLDYQALAKEYFGDDSQWYVDNIPFFECSDNEIEAVYYYRWKMYRAHIRNTGPDHFVITEFINDVHWDRDPFSTINAASGHHIYEGRWLKDDRYMNSYINYLSSEGGNNRSYSEWIADAAYARYLVNGDSLFIVSQLDSLKSNYEGWSDHWEESKSLYFIPAMPDATEYTIASIDASGGKDGFAGGEAFRPTFNSYMYGNAIAISKIASLKGDHTTAAAYNGKATILKDHVQQSLWNPSFSHFTDRFKADNKFVHYWDFIRGRELAGMVPWAFNLPDNNSTFDAAWKHVLDTTQLLGQYGFRTNEPSYEYYFKQYVYTFGKEGSQWNGPSWPFQSSHVLTGMANFLNDYRQSDVTSTDYLKLLRLFTKQHYLPDGKINLVENYDPNKGRPIVHFRWSNHYNHSSYNNLVISGLCGLRPSANDTLVINPLIDPSIRYFMLDDIRYHGHKLTVMYDQDGTHYSKGTGLNVFLDGKKTDVIHNNGKYEVYIGPVVKSDPVKRPVNLALNIRKTGYPIATASVNTEQDSIYQSLDGRVWYFPEITNYWSTEGSTSDTDWFAVDFGSTKDISGVKLYLYADGKKFTLPDSVDVEYNKAGQWIKAGVFSGSELAANTSNALNTGSINSDKIRIVFRRRGGDVGLTELEIW